MKKLYNAFMIRFSFAKTVALTLAVFFVALFLALSIKRVFFPHELEWMEGSMIDHALRIYSGKQLYVKPTIEFVNWLYQPLYYIATAAVMSLTGISYLAGRLVSFSSVILTCGLLYLVVRRLTKPSMFYALISPALYLAAYHVTGYSFDVARVDAFLVFLVVLSISLLLFSQKPLAVIGAAFVFTLALFTKQQAVFYIVPIAVWLFLNNRASLLLYLVVVGLCFSIGTYLLIHANGDWYLYYVYAVPKAKAVSFGYFKLPMVFPNYLLSAWCVGCLTVIIYIVTLSEKKMSFLGSSSGFVFMTLCTSAIQLSMHLGDQMSYNNISMPFAAMFALSFPIAVSRLSLRVPAKWGTLLPWAISLQFLALLYNPYQEDLIVIKEKHYIAGDRFLTTLRMMQGNVLVSNHSFFPILAGKRSYANELATSDVYAVGDTTSRELLREWNSAIKNQYFDAIITDESIYAGKPTYQGYVLKEQVNIPPIFFGSHIGPFLTAPRYVYVPSPSSLEK